MTYLFYYTNSLKTLDVTNFDTGNVTNISRMFYKCSLLLKLDITNFNTSKVTNMSHMFHGCGSIEELDISSFDTTNVTSMETMLAYLYKINTIYVGSKWTMANVTNSNDMFLNSKVQQVTLKTL